jgi:hypothetical protein
MGVGVIVYYNCVTVASKFIVVVYFFGSFRMERAGVRSADFSHSFGSILFP